MKNRCVSKAGHELSNRKLPILDTMAPQRVITTLMMLLIPPAGMAGGSAATPMLAAQVRSRWRACRPLQSDSVPCCVHSRPLRTRHAAMSHGGATRS